MDYEHDSNNSIPVFNELLSEEKADEWSNFLIDAYEDIFNSFIGKISTDSPIVFSINHSLVREVVEDAANDLSKINEYYVVAEPNPFALFAYLAYWWMRHKPAEITHPENYDIEMIKLSEKEKENKNIREIKTSTKTLHWKLKHINELVAVQLICSFIFQIKIGAYITTKRNMINQGDEFSHLCFEDMIEDMMEELLYYFAYRPLELKAIETIIESYPIYPE